MVDVHLVTGFLGSGKTSLLRHALDLGRLGFGTPGLVIHDVAELNVDGYIIEREHPELSERIVRLAERDGRSYLAGNMVPHVLALLERGCDRVIVETSGAAHSWRILEELVGAEELQGRARVGASITVVDAHAYGFTRKNFGALLDAQILVADLVVLNKRDRVSKERLAEIAGELRALVPEATLVETYEGQVPSAVLRTAFEDKKTPAIRRLPPVPDDGFRTLVYRNDRPAASQVAFGHNLLNIPMAIARIKGLVKLHGETLLMSGVPGQLDWHRGQARANTCVAFIGQFEPEALRAEVDRVYLMDGPARPLKSGKGEPA